MPLNLAGLPWFLGQVIERTLANEKCTPDFPLLIAESLEECAEILPAQTVWRAPCIRVAKELRTLAPSYAKPPAAHVDDAKLDAGSHAWAPGKDQDGTPGKYCTGCGYFAPHPITKAATAPGKPLGDFEGNLTP